MKIFILLVIGKTNMEKLKIDVKNATNYCRGNYPLEQNRELLNVLETRSKNEVCYGIS